MKWNKKQVMCLLSILLVASIAIGGIVMWLHQEKLEQLQNEALAELERNEGQYDEQSIVLYETSKAKAEELAKLYGAALRITENGRFATLTLPEGTTIRDVYAMEESRKYISDMAADYHVQTSELTEEEGSGERLPQRPQYSVSDTDYELQIYLDYLNMGNVWDHCSGFGITVAVIDTGIDTDHPEFVGRISEYSYNASEDKIVKDYNDWSLIEDEVGHGTAVTGVVAASMHSGNVVGIAPDVEIIVIKAECDQNGSFRRTSDLVFGLYYAIERDVHVVNMSFGTYGINPFAEAVQLAYDSDIICVAAAGNNATSMLMYPAADEHVIGVGAMDGWELAEYSNYGENVNLCAPGTTYTSLMDGKYGNMTGTSLASPIVAGAMALLLQNNPYITFDDVTEILYASCYDLGDLGRDWYYGFGALDISALILEERGTITYDMLTDELENMEGLFIQGHTLQELPEPERLYAVFDGWYYDDTFTQEYNYYTDKFYGEVTLYAKWVNEDDGIPYTYVILDDGTVEIRSYTGHRRYITIPEMIEGRVVSSIGDFAFANQTRLREVTLPSSLNHIGLGAFQNCANLISIQIPENVTEIEGYAFSGNVRLSAVAFLGNSKLQTIGDFAFESCGRLERIELPASLENINGSAFYGATALYKIGVQPANIHYQSNEGVLYNLSGSTLVSFPAAWGSNYTLPENTEYIGDYAFAFAKLTEIELSNVTGIGNYGFVMSNLESIVIPDCVTSLGVGAFEGDNNLTNIELGRGLTAISVKAFSCCSSLKQIMIPNGVARIEGSAFSGSGLQTVTFEENSSLYIIDGQAFDNCHISQIDIPDSVLSIGSGAFSGLYIGNPLVHVGFGENSQLQSIGLGAFAKCNQLEQIQLPAGVHTIGDFAFQYSGLTQITVPARVTYLGVGAFACCSNLVTIEVEEGNAVYHDLDGIVHNLENTEIHVFPAGREMETYTVESTVQTVMPWAFAGTAKLGHVIMPEGMTVVGEYGLYMSGIRNVTLPESLIEIQQYAFAKCGQLQYVQIPDNVLQIGRYAFSESRSLHTVDFHETSKLPRLSYGAFAYSGITSFRVPANVSTMAQGVFEGCRNLYSVTFAANSKLESISAYMFDGCTNLQTITFEQGSALTSIQAHGLEGMDQLSYIDFGDAKLTNIDNFAFRFCENLQTVHLPETVTNIGRYVFYGCKSLSQLTIPANVEHIGSFAFLAANDVELYFVSENLPLYLDENWDYATRGYYTGVSGVEENDEYRYAVLPSGNISILEYMGNDTHVDLTQVNLGGKITIIGGSAFEGSSVESIVLPESLTAIQAEAFAYSALKQITIPADVTFIGREAFAYTDITELTFAKKAKLTVIEQYAFEGTKKLTYVNLPESLTTLGTGVFLGSGLQSVEFAKKIQLQEIPQRAFAETKLTSVVLPDSVILVNHNAFNNVQTLKSVTFGKNDGIRLMSNAFYHTGLESLHIPANVTYIGEYCFVALGNLKEFTVDAKNPNYMAEDGLLFSKDGRKLIAVPAGRTGSLTVPKSVETIGFGAFEGSKLSEILFHADANILTFGYRAFFKAENITTITIPKSVVSIDYYAFAYCENLREVIFVEGNQLKGIYEGAFCGDANLESIMLPDSIVEISDFAFYGCSKITKVPISDTSKLKGIYDYAFAYTGLSGEFTTPESLWDIGNYAFLGCNFTKVTIPDTNKKILLIGIGAFEDCNHLEEIILPFIGASYEDQQISWFGYIFGAGSYGVNGTYMPESLETVTLTDGLTTIYTGGFAYCTGLETINVPYSVSVLFPHAFAFTNAKYELTNTITAIDDIGEQKVNRGHFGSGLTGKLILAPGTTEIGESTFQSVRCITEVVLPDSVSIIGNRAFWMCGSLTSITLPAALTTIDEMAFWECYGLYCIYNNSSLSLIPGDSGYAGLAEHAKIIIGKDGSKTYAAPGIFETEDGFLFVEENGEYSLLAYLGEENIVTLPEAVNGRDYCIYHFRGARHVTIPEGITRIDNEAFYEYSALESIHIPSSVASIGERAFMRCNSLKSVVIPDGVETICDSAFYECGALEFVHIPSSVTTIEGGAFSWCSNLTNVTIPNGVTSLGWGAFYNCINLMDVRLPDSLEILGDYAFADCHSLRNVHFGNSLSSIGVYAFSQCYKLGSVFIPESVTHIGGAAFESNTVVKYLGDAASFVVIDGITYNADLTEVIGASTNITGTVILPDSVVIIHDRAFQKCAGMTDILIPDSVTTIGYSAFADCYGLTQLVIPNSVTYLGEAAFGGCNGLVSVTLPESITEIPAAAFCNCQRLKDVTLPTGLLVINRSAFAGCGALTVMNIPQNVVSIEDSAFESCDGLYSITLPSSLEHLGDNAFIGCNGLYVLENDSKLQLSMGSESNGMVALNAKVMVDREGNKTYAPDCFVIDDFLVIREGNAYTLLAYLGQQETVTLPTDINGKQYAIRDFRGAKHLIIPEGRTVIDEYAFRGDGGLESITLPESIIVIQTNAFEKCKSLTEIMLPCGIERIEGGAFSDCSGLRKVTLSEGLASIGLDAFRLCENLMQINLPQSLRSISIGAFDYCNSLFHNPAYYQNGLLIIDGWIIDADSDIGYLTDVRAIRGVADRAFEGCNQLKQIVWGSMYGSDMQSNVETVYITYIDQRTAYLQNTVTLNNVVVFNTVDASDLRHCESLFWGVSGVTIFVEALEEDLRWDDNFPGWSNGNKVVYGDQWHWVNFYDENGKLISSQPCLNAQIIRLPIYQIAPDAHYTYEIVGWDLDGDGEVDSIPATSVVEINAKPVVVTKQRQYTVQFADATTGTIYHQVQLPYGAVITAPANPEKRGHDFLRWAGLYDGMIVTGDTVIYASWKHHGNGHEYAEPVWVEASCTEPGYNKHTCTICGEFYGTDYTEPMGHSYQQTQVAASCAEGGYTLHSCSRCGHSYKDNFTPAEDHQYGDWENEALPSCTQHGSRHHTCKQCGYQASEKMPAKGHKFKETGREDSTCDKNGKRKLACEDCGLHIEEDLPKKNHGYQKNHGNGQLKAMMDAELEDIFWEYEGANIYFYACSDCGNVLSTKDSDQGKVGTASTVCKHRYSSQITVSEPNCMSLGVYAEICDSCGEAVSLSVFGALAHNYVTEVTEATCEQSGYATHTCSGCGDSYVDSYTDALGHDMGQWVITTEPTCTVAGAEECVCSRCDHSESQTISAKGHNYTDGICENCGQPEAVLGDVNGDGKVTTADARMILLYIVGKADADAFNELVADVNGDGNITTADARVILLIIVGKN